MKHFTEDELILYFYGESRRAGPIDRHLGECAACAAAYRDIAATLELVGTPETPARDEQYGEQVWSRIRPHLAEQEHVGWLAWISWHRVSLAAMAATALVAVAIGGGIMMRQFRAPTKAPSVAVVEPRPTADTSDRARLVAIGDHLEQSERVLLDVVNATGSTIDVSAQQALAGSLIEANRLYRDAAAQAGEGDVASLLDDLERSLLDLANGPSRLTPAQLSHAVSRLDAAALLFKIRVLSDELHERALAPAQPRTTL